jgi:hypothetical protein
MPERRTVLLQSDVSSDPGRYCPKCHADWRAGEIPRDSVARGSYGHLAPCERQLPWQLMDGATNAPCTCPRRYFSHLIGVETPGYDGVSFWMCPACSTRWDRWTGAEVADIVDR